MRIAFLLSVLLALQLGYFFSLRHQAPGSESVRQQTDLASKLADDGSQPTPGPQSPTPQPTTAAHQAEKSGAHDQSQAQPTLGNIPQDAGTPGLTAKPTPDSQSTPQTTVQATPTPQPTPAALTEQAKPIAVRTTKTAIPRKSTPPPAPRKLTEAEIRLAEAQPKAVRKKAREVVSGCHTDREKAYAIYRFVAENVKYDVYSYLHLPTSKYPSQDAEVVLARKDAVCEGYSRLYDSMAKSVGLECRFVPGEAWATPGSAKKSRGHAWNAVKWDGSWHPVDSTWGAGSTDTETQTFTQEPSDDWFLLSPDQFAYSHLPDHAGDLFGAKKRTLKEFGALPHLEPQYFLGHYTIGNATHPAQNAYRFQNEVAISFHRPSAEVDVSAEVTDSADNSVKQMALVNYKSDTEVEILAHCPQSGRYYLNIFAGAPENMSFVASVQLEAKQAGDTFPIQYRDFIREQADLQVGRTGKLKWGEPATIALRVPGRDHLYYQDESGRFPEFTLIGGAFTGTVTPRSDHFDIFVSNGNHYSTLLRYSVR